MRFEPPLGDVSPEHLLVGSVADEHHVHVRDRRAGLIDRIEQLDLALALLEGTDGTDDREGTVGQRIPSPGLGGTLPGWGVNVATSVPW